MINTFAELWEKVKQQNETVLLRADMSDKQSSVVLAKQEPQFCNQLAEIANSSPEALSELLGVQLEAVKKWHAYIMKAIKIADKAKAETKQQVMLPTGIK